MVLTIISLAAIILAIVLSFTVKGRISRANFVPVVLVAIVLGFIFDWGKNKLTTNIALDLLYIFFDGLVLVVVYYYVKRFHDIDKPGWYVLLLWVPIYNLYLFLLLIFKKGTMGPNKFGSDPYSITGGVAVSTSDNLPPPQSPSM
jgi:uncharacterized membrane protein YhaH (DUF805 family)